MKEGGDAAGKHGRRWWKNRRGGRLLSVWGVVSRCAGLRRTKNIQVLNDGSLITFSTSFLLISYTFLSANLILFNLCPAPPLFIFITSSMHTPPPSPPLLSHPTQIYHKHLSSSNPFCLCVSIEGSSVPMNSFIFVIYILPDRPSVAPFPPSLQPWLLLQLDHHEKPRLFVTRERQRWGGSLSGLQSKENWL